MLEACRKILQMWSIRISPPQPPSFSSSGSFSFDKGTNSSSYSPTSSRSKLQPLSPPFSNSYFCSHSYWEHSYWFDNRRLTLLPILSLSNSSILLFLQGLVSWWDWRNINISSSSALTFQSNVSRAITIL